MRKFKGLVFLGSGLHSLAERARLHRRLDEALDLSGGMQQPQHWDHEPTQAEREATERVDRESVQEVEDACRDLVAALVGRDISFGETLPYPASDSDPPPPVDLCDAGSRPAIMDSPDGPTCGCGRPSRHESGWCGLPRKERPSAPSSSSRLRAV
jgi:hypothetical protein